MATRIPLSWIVLLILLGVFAFFGYHILQASSPDGVIPIHKVVNMIQHPEIAKALPQMGYDEQEQGHESPHLSIYEETGQTYEHGAPVVPKQKPIPNKMPSVPAQTEDDLRATQPIMATPPSVQYDTPEAIDPLNRTVYMGAEFGSNLRHPEQMIELSPSVGMGGVVASGLGSEHSGPGGNRSTGYAPEMAQNGGEFMQGINAYDLSDYGAGYSIV